MGYGRWKTENLEINNCVWVFKTNLESDTCYLTSNPCIGGGLDHIILIV